MWQSWQPAVTPVRLTACTLCFHSAATHCIEWHAVLQNSLLPVAFTMTWVPMIAAAPMTMPMTTSASTDQRALGDVRPRQLRRSHPGRSAGESVGAAIVPPHVVVAKTYTRTIPCL